MTGGVNSASRAMKLILAVKPGGQPSQEILTISPTWSLARSGSETKNRALRLPGGDRRLLLGAFQRKDRPARCDRVAFLDGQCRDATALLGADQHQVGFHIAGHLGALIGLVGEQDQPDHRHGDEADEKESGSLHDAPSLACGARTASTMRSIWVFSIPSVSRW